MNNRFKLKLEKDQLPFLIMAHRGHHGGNIIMNTKEAVMLAVKAGADIVEVDVCRSKDGQYYLFHDTEETTLLGDSKPFNERDSQEIESINLLNAVNQPSGYFINRLQEFLSWLPEEILINVDRSWKYWDDPAFVEIIKSSGKLDQLIFKSPVDARFLEEINSWKLDALYMPILKKQEELNLVLKYDQIKVIGLELIIADPECSSFDNNWIHNVSETYLIMVNAEDLGEKHHLFGRLTDSLAILADPNDAWGEMVKMGASIIQTDWPHFLEKYRSLHLKYE